MAAAVALRAGDVALALGLCACASFALAQEVPPPAYQLAAQQAGVPSPVLYAVAQESGARLRGRLIPWPWTLNVAGRAERYATRADACAGIRRALARTPANRIDAGLGQVNLGYHAQRYDHPATCSIRTATSPSPRKSCRSSTRRARIGWSPSAATTVLRVARPPPATAAASTST